MKNILVLGAGLSTTSLIHYLLNNAEQYGWHITVTDIDANNARKKVNGHPRGNVITLNIRNEAESLKAITNADIVIFMLPAFMHQLIVEKCINLQKPLLSASYVSEELKKYDEPAKKVGIPILMELGVDPGIDHMSAMRTINRIKQKGGEIISFYSFTGGLVAPESDNNPWNYKLTWNPRNVVMAGKGISKYIQQGNYKYVPYFCLFNRILTRKILNYGEFEAYPNRDSLSYREIYGLKNIPSMLRATLRRPGYAKAWNVFVQLGITNDSYIIENSENMTYREFIDSFMEYEPNMPVEIKLQSYCTNASDPVVFEKLKWLGIFDKRKIGLKNATPAQILQKLLENKWALDPDDKDMLAMQHEFKYRLHGETKMIVSTMVCIGKNQEETAMAKTVGLPLGIATKLLATGQIKKTGIHRPIERDMYEPILQELEEYGIGFEEKEYRID